MKDRIPEFVDQVLREWDSIAFFAYDNFESTGRCVVYLAQSEKVELENEELRKRIKEKEECDKTASQYELHSTPGGAVVYRFKETPPHYACPNC